VSSTVTVFADLAGLAHLVRTVEVAKVAGLPDLVRNIANQTAHPAPLF